VIISQSSENRRTDEVRMSSNQYVYQVIIFNPLCWKSNRHHPASAMRR